MTDEECNSMAVRVVTVLGTEYGNFDPGEAIMALFGAILMIGREAGIDDYRLHQGFGGFLEDNAE